jgi:hypothetical protein
MTDANDFGPSPAGHLGTKRSVSAAHSTLSFSMTVPEAAVVDPVPDPPVHKSEIMKIHFNELCCIQLQV